MLNIQDLRKKESMLRFQIYENDSDSKSKINNNINNIKIQNNKDTIKKLNYNENEKDSAIKVDNKEILNKSKTSENYINDKNL